MKKKRQRAQPRSKTPPITLSADDGQRHVLLVDESLTTTTRSVTRSKQPILLELSAGLTITVKSRRLNKLRYPLLRITKDKQAN